MRYSNLFGRTLKEAPKDATLLSHKLLYQAGFIRESTAGRYYLLPLGLRVHQKIQRIIKEEMDAAGAQELITPVLHPKYLWEETNRTNTVGFELMSIKDRNKMEFVLGGTAEEMLVDLIRKFQLSYKDLPLNVYQFSVKFRDELRARGGLLRLREFVMKDAYSFDTNEAEFKKEYKKMEETYSRIFKRMGLKTLVVESDNGYIGGEYCHEFIVESDAGESKFLMTEDGAYAAHEDVAQFSVPSLEKAETDMKPMEDVEGVGIIGVEDLARFLKIPVEQTTKTILFETETGDVIAAAIRGDFDINETKLLHITGATHLKLASPEVVQKVTGAEVGYAGLLNLPASVRAYIDDSLRGRTNFEMGANKTNYHTINVNFGRDITEPEQFYDFKLAKEGYTAPSGKKLIAKKGIEVGNIFQLGYHYSSKMTGATFKDRDGKQKPYYMGCYGIGLARTMATIVEVSHDNRGIIWPRAVAPFTAHLILLGDTQPEIRTAAEHAYTALQDAGIEVLFDDRTTVSAGEKLADADLIGIPWRLIVSPKTKQKIEIKARSEATVHLEDLETVIGRIKHEDKS